MLIPRLGDSGIITPRRNYFVTVPFVAFEGHRIYLEARGPQDIEAMKYADALGRILKDRIFSNTAPTQPIIKPIGDNGDSTG